MELDPLLKDLAEKKLVFRNNVASLTAELKDVRARLASQEKAFARETQSRKFAETRARSMEEEIERLQMCLGDDWKLQASKSITEKHLKEFDDLRSQLITVQASADASAAAAQSAQTRCLFLEKELDERDALLKEHVTVVYELGKKLDHLQKKLEARAFSQMQLRDEILRLEKEIIHAVAGNVVQKDCDLRKVMEDASSNTKDGEIARLRDEIKFMSINWEKKNTELELQLEKHRTNDQELKKRVLKLEFCLQEARSQIRKLQKMEEKREISLKELRDQITTMKIIKNTSGCPHEQRFWESPGFKIFVSISMLVLVLYTRR